MNSLVGATIGALSLAISIPIMRPLVLLFGSPELSTAAYGAKWLLFPTVIGLIILTVFTVAYPTIKERMGKAKYERPENAM